ncbi:MAG: haloacid dehalogenase-like hydrolase, partial [Candidatus Methylomirabilis sp.]|nr:haloacid dehalogenase-like hydrolase [Deltaproteobacteria bacterium]
MTAYSRRAGEGFTTTRSPARSSSGSPHFLSEAIAEFLGVADAIGTRARYKDGVSGRKIEHPICYREGKLALVEARLAALGLPIEECVVYTDHEIDLPLLERAGERVVVNPSPAL